MTQAESLLKNASGVDAILLDLGLPDSDGLESLARAEAAAPHVPIVVLTGFDDEELGVEAVRKGAQDYLVKGQTTTRLLTRVIRHAVERNRLIEAKNQFLANISHELRTPLNAVLGMIDLALREPRADHSSRAAPAPLTPAVREYLTTARESADLLLGLLNNLLDSAKIESGNLELEMVPMSIRQVLNQTASTLAVRAGEKGLAFVCHAADNLPEAVLGDKLRLRQVLLNLGGNAIKFTERGQVEMGVRVVELDGRKGEGKKGRKGERENNPIAAPLPHSPSCPQPDVPDVVLEFFVRDTGIGIPPGDLERIFKPFAQGDASIARRYGGTGLGLSISADLVALMGGRIWAESEPGQGSTFHFTICLPLAGSWEPGAGGNAVAPDSLLPAPRSLPGHPLDESASRPLRILLVEDNPASQKLARFILQEAGHAADVARDGEQALQLIGQMAYDAVLMDVQMPVMDGLTATAAIRALEARTPPGTSSRRRLPIIAMTARAMKGDRQRCLKCGMDGYVSKPIDAAQLLDEIARLTAGRSGEKGIRDEGVGIGGGSIPNRQSPIPNPSAPVAAAAPVFDLPSALEHCCQSWEMFSELIECLFADDKELFPKMRAALQNGSFEELGRLAHRLRGTLACLASEPLTDTAAALERCADRDHARAPEALAILEQQVAALKAALAIYRAQEGPVK